MQRNDSRLRPIPGFLNYYVEELTGNIWSFMKYKNGQILKPQVDLRSKKTGKPERVVVSLYRNRQQFNMTVARLVINISDPKITVDHIDRNIWHNWKSNLRAANSQQQIYNRPPMSKSGFKGVYLRLNSNYEVYLRKDSNNTFLGCYHNIYEAAAIWNVGASEFQGEFAVYNKVDGYILTI